MICKKCGHEIENDSLFCTYCGAKIDESLEEKNEEVNELCSEEVIDVNDIEIVDNAETLSDQQVEIEKMTSSAEGQQQLLQLIVCLLNPLYPYFDSFYNLYSFISPFLRPNLRSAPSVGTPLKYL